MSRLIDLSYPIRNHFRWPVERRLTASFEEGDDFQVTRIGFAVHGFTHIDAPRHISPEGETTSAFDLETLVGEAAIVDLTGVSEESPINAAMLAAAQTEIRPGDRVLLRTDWDRRFALDDRRFWTRAPYLERGACEWLAERRPSLVGFDFPQDYPIRGLLDGEPATMTDFVSHDVLLRRGVPMIEYLCNLSAVRTERPRLCALPLKLMDADGAPARVVAIEP